MRPWPDKEPSLLEILTRPLPDRIGAGLLLATVPILLFGWVLTQVYTEHTEREWQNCYDHTIYSRESNGEITYQGWKKGDLYIPNTLEMDGHVITEDHIKAALALYLFADMWLAMRTGWEPSTNITNQVTVTTSSE